MSQLSMPGYSQLLNTLMGSIQAPRVSGGASPVAAGFANMMNQANQANAARGQAILGLLSGQGAASMQDVDFQLQNDLGNINQDAMNRGIYNTTIVGNMQQEARDRAGLAKSRIQENSALNVANMANSFSQRGPDMGMLANIMMNGGQSGGRIVQGIDENDPIFGLKRPGFLG